MVSSISLGANMRIVLLILFSQVDLCDIQLAKKCAAGNSRKKEAHITIRLESDHAFNRLYFRDTGCGISANDLPYIFDDFVSDKSTTMGLGLGFCRRVMDILGGRIECQSKQGKYTLFTLSFPIL